MDGLQDDRFLLLETLGRGGMGAVYGAYDRVDHRLVALKVLGGRDAPGPAHPLSAEFEAWSEMRHPNIVRAYELAHSRSGPLAAGAPYLVMEHVRGGAVHRVLSPGHVAPSVMEALARQLLRALTHVHAAGYVHRDLKPANVLLCGGPRGPRRVKLTDFGLAAPMGVARQAGTVSGSLPYVSPEVLLGLPLDGRADLYGLGILLYQLATGDAPAPTGDAEQLVRWHLSGPPVDPSPKMPGMPVKLARLIRRLAARDREERPATAEQALLLLGGDASPGAVPAPSPRLDRAARAKLRLALDAVRSGARRVLRLSHSVPDGVALWEEIAVASQVLGVSFHRLGPGTSCQRGSLARLVLRLLAERGTEAAGCLERYGLDVRLPLGLVGGLAVLEPQRPPLADLRSIETAARGVSRFLLSCAARRPWALGVQSEARLDPLGSEVIRQLESCLRSTHTPTRCGGLLLVVGDSPASGIRRG